MRPLLCLLPLAIGLAACQPEPDQTGEDVAATPTAIPVEPDGGTGAGAPPLAEVQATTIPEKYRGTWDADAGSCDAASDMRMEIGAQGIDFYESHGDVTAVKPGGKDGIIVSLAMEGEGEEWNIERRLDLSADGKILSTSDAGAPPDQKPLSLKRCKA